MGRFDINLSEVVAGQLVLPKGEHDILVGEPVAFYNSNEGKVDDKGQPKAPNWGVSFPLTVKSGEYDGQTLGRVQFYLHTPGATKMTKQFLMAALGFDASIPASEQEFNAKFAGNDFWIDTDTNEMAPIYKEIAGRMVKCIAGDPKPNTFPGREGQVQANYRWMPFQ